MDNITHPLTEEVPVVVTPDAPVTPHQLKVDQPAPDLAIITQISDMYPAIDPNIIQCLVTEIVSKLHGIATQEGMPSPMAPAILAGKYSMQEIVSYLGFDYKEFKTDLRKVYGEYQALRNPVASEYAVQSMFRNKYGLNIRPTELAAAEDEDLYWRTALAAAVDKIERNLLEAGDEVLITSRDSNFGKTATLMALTDEDAEVLMDGVVNLPVKVGDPKNSLRLLSGLEKRAMLKIGTDTSTTAAWYKAVGASVYSKLQDLEPVTIHKVANQHMACVHSSYKGDINAEVNLENLVSIYGQIQGNTKLAALKVTPTPGMPDHMARGAVSDIVDQILLCPEVEDIQIRFSGSRGYYVIAKFATVQIAAYHQNQLKQVVSAYLDGVSNTHFIVGASVEPKKIVISTDVRVVPAAYSVDHTTGLVCVPLDPMKLDGFDPQQATIASLSEAYGLGIGA